MPLKIPRDAEPQLNLIPMIDIMLQLLIFFMLGTKFIEMDRKIELEVPRVVNAGALDSPPERRVINVYRDGVVTLDGKEVTLPQLQQRLADVRRQYTELGVMVRGDRTSQFQLVADVLNTCRQAGIQELAIAVLPAVAPSR